MNYFKNFLKMKRPSENEQKSEISFREILESYNAIKGKRKSEFPVPFWDIVALTTANEDQKQCVEQQIDHKLANKELPVDIPYVVVCDPPNCRIGSGGANFLILQELYELYRERLFELKILLIHTGGQSQRLPSHSILGKLFAIFPSGDEISRLLDIKLALYHPFVARMKPGVFVTCSDDIETYWLDPKDGDWSFENDGFTALAHPSPISIGLTHGVYVLPTRVISEQKTSFMSTCLRVLQKPNYQLMQEAAAILKMDGDESEFVYSDSAYFFTHSVSKSLLDSIPSINPYQSELCAYGDFLQPLGENSIKNYNFGTGRAKSALLKTQKKLFNLLKDIELRVLVLNKSTFYHLGTMAEYLDNLTNNNQFKSEIGLSEWSYSTLASLKEPEEDDQLTDSVRGVIMHSVLRVESVIGPNVVVECCDFETPIQIERGIISHCKLKSDALNGAEILTLPSDILWHTAAVIYRNSCKYVTVVFNLTDDIKLTTPKTESDKLRFLGSDLKRVAELLNIKTSDLLFDSDLNRVSLWQLQMFPIRSTREDSFKATLSLVNRLVKASTHDLSRSWLTTPRMSMEDVMNVKCVADMIKFQRQLHEKIGE